MKIFSTFISGAEKIIERAIKKRPIEKIKILSLLDGLIIYETSYSLKDIRGIRFFNNSFILLKHFPELGSNPIFKMFNEILKSFHLEKKVVNEIQKNKTFKIVTSLENQTVAAPWPILQKMEAKITEVTKLVLDIKNPDIEFWFIVRREKIGLFGIRLNNRVKSTNLQKGELRPELAHILCLESKPDPNDIFLDPFAGYGSIPAERAIGFPYKKIFVNEIDSKNIRILKNKFHRLKNIFVTNDNAISMAGIPNESISKIVTDPPWGLFETPKIPISEFYHRTFKEFYRILKQNGVAVVLIANVDILKNTLEKLQKYFEIIEKFNILVSGKKALIVKLKKLSTKTPY